MDKIKTKIYITILSVKSSILKAYTIIRHSHKLLFHHLDHCIVMLMASSSLVPPHN